MYPILIVDSEMRLVLRLIAMITDEVAAVHCANRSHDCYNVVGQQDCHYVIASTF